MRSTFYVCPLRCLFGIRRLTTTASLSDKWLYFTLVPLTSSTLPARRLCSSSEKCSSTATSSQSPFDPDIHFLPTQSTNVEPSPSATLPADWQNVPIVYTTGISYKNDDGTPIAKIGIYWGDGDVLNRFKVLGMGSTILAEIEAITLALKQAIYEQHLSRVIVRTDSDYVCRCIAKYFTFWKESDFYKANGDKVKYADELQELDRLLSMIEARVEYVPKNKPNVGNWVLNKLKSKRSSGKGDILWSTQSESSLSAGDTSIDSENCLVVYTCGAYRDTDLRGEPFTRAGIGTYWPSKRENNISRRLSMFPVTLFRSQLQAIIIALEQAVDAKCLNVVIRTDSRVFLKFFLRQWRKADGTLVKNYPQYLRIVDLASRLKAKFEYAGENSKEREEALILAEDGMSQPMVNEAKRLLRRGVSDPLGSTTRSWKVVVDSNEGDWTGVDRVCLLCDANPETRRATYCVYWDGDNHQLSTVGWVEGVKRAGSHAIRKALILALEQASESDRKRLIIRMSAVRLLKTVIEWIPQWRRNEWISSVGKPIVNADQWKYVDELLHDIEIKWEYSDSADANDELKEVDRRARNYLQANFAIQES